MGYTQLKKLYKDWERYKSMSTKLLAMLSLVLIFAFLAGCDGQPPQQKYDINVLGRPYLGGANASVVVVEFSDFQCPFCKTAVATKKQLLNKYGDKIKFVYKQFPLENIHQNSLQAAEASECAFDQGKFWEYHDILFENQNRLGSDNLKAFAGQIGLDTAKFNQCLDSGVKESIVRADQYEGAKIGVQGTPTFFINGVLSPSYAPSEMEKIIDAELAKAQ